MSDGATNLCNTHPAMERITDALPQQLGQAAMIAGRPDLTINEARADHLLDWRHINVA